MRKTMRMLFITVSICLMGVAAYAEPEVIKLKGLYVGMPISEAKEVMAKQFGKVEVSKDNQAITLNCDGIYVMALNTHPIKKKKFSPMDELAKMKSEKARKKENRRRRKEGLEELGRTEWRELAREKENEKRRKKGLEEIPQEIASKENQKDEKVYAVNIFDSKSILGIGDMSGEDLMRSLCDHYKIPLDQVVVTTITERGHEFKKYSFKALKYGYLLEVGSRNEVGITKLEIPKTNFD